jgi:hypothetical protein
VQQLRAAGHVKLFPELKKDAIKGYGKQAGQWFNDRVLFRKLGFPRDGKKSFHSFRHTFITRAFSEQLMPEMIATQLTGHAIGGSTASAVYNKGSLSATLFEYLAAMQFPLPEIAKFDCNEGLKAIEDALKRKSAKGYKRKG